MTVTATYSGVSKTTTLTVTRQSLRASFKVTGTTRGTDACTITNDEGDLDCEYDGSGSQGQVDEWIWTTTVGSKEVTHSSNSAVTSADDGCNFLTGAAPVTANGRPQYVSMQVKLQVEDADGNKSTAVTRTVRLYPDSNCDYGF